MIWSGICRWIFCQLRTTDILLEVFSFNKVNFVNPFQQSDKSLGQSIFQQSSMRVYMWKCGVRQVEEMIAEEREYSSAQNRTLLNEQRKTIIAEYCEKVSHHEFHAVQAEQDCRILQEELLRQQQDFREVHQQDLIKMKELQKFQNSTFGEFTRQEFIEDQKSIMELCGRGDLCRDPHRVLDPATVPRATVPRGCGLRWRRARGDAS